MMFKVYGICLFALLYAKFFVEAKVVVGAGEEKPSLLCSLIFLEKYKSGTFSYAPWGNFDEENATIIDFTVGSGALSRNLVYYGQSPIRIFESTFDSEGEEQNKSVAAELSFTTIEGKTVELAYVLLSREKRDLWKIYSIPFDQNILPLGSYRITSQAKGNLYIIFDKNKFTLPGGGSKIVSSNIEGDSRKVSLKGFIKSSKGYAEIINKFIPCSPKKRGVLFIAYNGKQAKISSVTEFFKPIERAHGFGLPSVHTNIEAVSQNEEKSF